ncbi:hypothetical protein GW17_00033653 [Ensete ventricosum]|nr:hypothetical protein GW17_00033653 [Ensete ventricosum]
MRSHGIDCSDALELDDAGSESGGGISVRAVCDLTEGDLVATIPKSACLTIRTSGARDMIESAGLAGYLGLVVALMFERSRGPASPWQGYLQLLPERECVPLVWSLQEVDTFLSGTELHMVFNTYGSMGNAALLHRYGFTEADNPFDIVNIDVALLVRWCSSTFSNRYARARISLWRRLNYSGCTSQHTEYFEISYDGEPQLDLLVLLYIIFLVDDAYEKLSYMVDAFDGPDESTNIVNLIKITRNKFRKAKGQKKPEDIKELLVSDNVCSALISLADLRESLYGTSSLDENMNMLKRCCPVKDRKLYHSLILRTKKRYHHADTQTERSLPPWLCSPIPPSPPFLFSFDFHLFSELSPDALPNACRCSPQSKTAPVPPSLSPRPSMGERDAHRRLPFHGRQTPLPERSLEDPVGGERFEGRGQAVYAIMGKNGSGKRTFSKVLFGHPDYEVTGRSVLFKDQNLLEMEPEERSHVGLFMSFQIPVEMPGVSNFDFLLMAFNCQRITMGYHW